MTKEEWAGVEELRLATKLYINACSHMQAAMKDGLNVQGALSNFIGCEQRANDAIDNIAKLRPVHGAGITVMVRVENLRNLQTLISDEFGGFIPWIDEALSK